MTPLMPAAVKGANIFHAINASQAMSDSGLSNNFGDNEGEGVNTYEEQEYTADNINENQPQTPPATEIEADEEHLPWSPSPPPQSRSLHLFNDHKRRHSAISSSTSSATNTVQKKTRRDASSASALHGLGAKLDSFGDTLLEGIARVTPAATPSSTLAPSPMRKTRAITRAQELEVDLDDVKLAALIRIFQSDVNAADAYMVINRAGLRKAWIEDTLPIM
jgi:hypothetical protein